MTFTATSAPVSNAAALKFAIELETIISEIGNGKRKASHIPMEPMVALIQFARDTVSATNAAAGVPGRNSDTEELRLTAAHLRRAIEDAERRARNSIKTNSTDPEDWRADMQLIADDLNARLKV